MAPKKILCNCKFKLLKAKKNYDIETAIKDIKLSKTSGIIKLPVRNSLDYPDKYLRFSKDQKGNIILENISKSPFEYLPNTELIEMGIEKELFNFVRNVRNFADLKNLPISDDALEQLEISLVILNVIVFLFLLVMQITSLVYGNIEFVM